MAEPQALNTQADRIAEAKRVQAAREQGIRAQAIKEGREKERAEICATLGVKRIEDAGLIEELRKEHRNELVSLQLHFDKSLEHIESNARHRAASGFWRGVGTMGVVTVLLCAATGYGVSFFLAESQMNAVAITQAATRPSAEAMRQSMQPQQGGGFQ